jgi:hypothetical protein
MANWKTDSHLEHHFERHRAEFRGASLEEYDASARDTLDVGTYFEYLDEDSGDWRTGCYHRETRRLTVLPSLPIVGETHETA